MRIRRHRFQPEVNGCERRALLSTTGATLPAAASGLSGTSVNLTIPVVLPIEVVPQQVVPLSGAFKGQFTRSDRIPDIGATFSPTGSGSISRLGRFSLKGSIHTIGFIQVGPVEGRMVLKGAAGTITLELTTLERGGGTLGLPARYRYTVAGGTGQYRNITDSGTAALTTVVTRGQNNVFGLEHGRFELVLNSAS
jgi:hypothetical protein